MYCMNCGKEIDETAVFCKNCGARVKSPVAGNVYTGDGQSPTGNMYPMNAQPMTDNAYPGNEPSIVGNMYPGNGQQIGNCGVPNPMTGKEEKTKEKKQKIRKKKDSKKMLIVSLILFAVVVIGGAALGTFLYVRKKQQATISYMLKALQEYYDTFYEDHYDTDTTGLANTDVSVAADSDCACKLLFVDEKPVMMIADLVDTIDNGEAKKVIYDFYAYECVEGKVVQVNKLPDIEFTSGHYIPVFAYEGKIYIIGDKNYCMDRNKVTVEEDISDFGSMLIDYSSYGCIVFPINERNGRFVINKRPSGGFYGDYADALFSYMNDHFEGDSEYELDRLYAEYLLDNGYENSVEICFAEQGIWFGNELAEDEDVLDKITDGEASSQTDDVAASEDTGENEDDQSDNGIDLVTKYYIDGTFYDAYEDAEKVIRKHCNPEDFHYFSDDMQQVTDVENWQDEIQRSSGAHEYEISKDELAVLGIVDPEVTDIVIPEKVHGYSVVCVDLWNQYDISAMRIQIPSSIRYIELQGFVYRNITLFCEDDSYAKQFAEEMGCRYIIGTIEKNSGDTAVVPGKANVDEETTAKYCDRISEWIEDLPGELNSMGYLYNDINADGIPELYVFAMADNGEYLDRDHIFLYLDKDKNVQEITDPTMQYNPATGEIMMDSSMEVYEGAVKTDTVFYQLNSESGLYEEAFSYREMRINAYATYEEYVLTHDGSWEYTSDYAFIDMDQDGIVEMIVDEVDLGYTIYRINNECEVVPDMLICGDCYYTPDGTVIDEGEVAMSMDRPASKIIYTVDPATGQHSKVHEMRLEFISYDAFLALGDDTDDFWHNADVMDFYVDDKEYATYKKAVKKFRSYYDKDQAVKLDITWYDTLEETYENRK